MYDLPHFKANSNEEVLAFMKAHPFITLCGIDAGNKPVATHVPVMFAEKDGKLILRAHIQRQTDHHKAFLHNPNVLAIFTGAHSYVSASWYPDPKVASTWNYQAVHASGTLALGGDELLLELLTGLTDHFENNPHSPALLKTMHADYVSKQMKAIVAFEITVTDIRHVFKLSQNRDQESKTSIIEHLERSADQESQQVGIEMQKHFSAKKGEQ